MFRPMRRKKKEISLAEAVQLLKNERRGVLSVNGDNGYPYAVPVNFLYDDESNKIYFHGSKAGHKADALKKDDKVCFTVYGNEQIKDELWAPYLQSTVVFGRCHIIEERAETIKLAKKFAMKYYPDEKTVDEEMEVSGKAVHMYEITIEHISGKQIQEK